jgi:hypothetical protein
MPNDNAYSCEYLAVGENHSAEPETAVKIGPTERPENTVCGERWRSGKTRCLRNDVDPKMSNG